MQVFGVFMAKLAIIAGALRQAQRFLIKYSVLVAGLNSVVPIRLPEQQARQSAPPD